MPPARNIRVALAPATAIALLSCQTAEPGVAPAFDYAAVNSVSAPVSFVPYGTAVMDGNLGDDWTGALTLPLYDDAGQVIEGARVLVMNDAVNLYVGLFVPDAPGADRFDVRFDNDGGGIIKNDQDEVIALGPGIETDNRLVDSHAEMGAYCCWAYADAHQDGAAAVSVSGQGVSYEISHPLDSGDPEDFSLGTGSVFGMCALYYNAPGYELWHGPSRCGYSGSDLSGYTRLIVSGPPWVDVHIDIKPGGVVNPINPESKGKVPVAILSTPGFDALTRVDRLSLTFGSTGDEHSLEFCNPSGVDVNGDGLADVMCHFEMAATGFTAANTIGILKGRTVDGIEIVGHDGVRVIR